jgi:hypothetical protein
MIKRIKTQEDIKKNKKRNQIIIGVILVGLMVLSTAGYAILSNPETKSGSEKTSYNGFTFVKNSGFWLTEVNGRTFIFQSLPQELENLTISGTFNLQDYSGKPLYIVNLNPSASIIIQNMRNDLERYQEACFEKINCTNKELPIKTCKDNLIIFLPEENKGVYKQENCVFITGNINNGADAFIYKLAGIM